MKHLFVCREYPPAAYPPGGIGTYARHMTRLLAEAGETVHVIAHRWSGAPKAVEEAVGGRMIVHRVALDEPLSGRSGEPPDHERPGIARGLIDSWFPAQAFSWQAALLAERLIVAEGIDIVEAQEWEAPLYFLQLRRMLDLAPPRRPPCLVHIHSPSERIFAANGWATTVADYGPAVAEEAYSITTADALLCPSRFIAREVVEHYPIVPSRVSVIPYPLGFPPAIERGAGVWSGGSICHIGRLEPRKGVLEFAEAAASIASARQGFDFVFAGGDTPLDAAGGATVGAAMRKRIPRRLRGRFRFLGSRDSDGVAAVLAASFVSVVPSRWENFPYSCIESMASGLPVLVSPNGGMREMVSDGISGWIAPDATPAGLAMALRRALDTTAAERERMGRAAAEAVRRLCDNDVVIEQHLALKRRLAGLGVAAPVRASIGLVRAPHGADQARRVVSPDAAAESASRGMAVVVVSGSDDSRLSSCLAALRGLTEVPAAVGIVSGNPRLDPADAAGCRIVLRERQAAGEAELAAAEHMIEDCAALAGLVFVDSRALLSTSFLGACSAAFARDDRLGVISPWTEELPPRARIHVPPDPARPHLWHGGSLAPCIAVRADALRQVIGHPGTAARARSLQSALDAVMAAGWGALAYPCVLCSLASGPGDDVRRQANVCYSSMARAARRLHMPLLDWFLECPPAERSAALRRALGDPLRTAWRIAERVIRGA